MDSTRDKIRRPGPRICPLSGSSALLKLGKDIREARIRRRITTRVMANRASITRMTLYKIERGRAISFGCFLFDCAVYFGND